MPDPIDQNIPPVAPSPTMSDPQAMVDAALNTPTSTQPTPPPPDPTPTPTTPTTETPVVPAPIPTPTPDAPAVAMGDDTPLAFVEKPTVTATAQEGTQTTSGTVPPNVGSSYLPPTPPPSTSMTSPVSETPKKKAGKIVGLFVGLLTLIGGIGGGYWYYTNYMGKTATVAIVSQYSTQASCEAACDGGHKLVWATRNGETGCYWSAKLCDSGGGGGTLTDAKVACEGTENVDYFRCGETPDGCGGFCVNGVSKTCDEWLKQECNFDPIRGAEYVDGIADKKSCPSGYQSTWCSCGGGNVCFSRGLENQCDTTGGLCDVYENSEASQGSDPTGATTIWYCENKFLASQGISCDDSTPGSKQIPSKLNCFCGTIQVDKAGQGYTSSESTCSCKSSTTPSDSPTAPSLACTGLTQAPVAPAIGDKVTFTCAGTITPTTAGTLTYKFRYSINNAAPTPMVNKTATTTELNIAACGEYKVECQTCATIAGVLKCDPNWVGATQ